MSYREIFSNMETENDGASRKDESSEEEEQEEETPVIQSTKNKLAPQLHFTSTSCDNIIAKFDRAAAGEDDQEPPLVIDIPKKRKRNKPTHKAAKRAKVVPPQVKDAESVDKNADGGVEKELDGLIQTIKPSQSDGNDPLASGRMSSRKMRENIASFFVVLGGIVPRFQGFAYTKQTRSRREIIRDTYLALTYQSQVIAELRKKHNDPAPALPAPGSGSE